MRSLPLLRRAVLLVLVGQAVAAPSNRTVSATAPSREKPDLFREHTPVNASGNAADDPPIPRPTNKVQPQPEKPYDSHESFHEIPERAPGRLAGVTRSDLLIGFLRPDPVRLCIPLTLFRSCSCSFFILKKQRYRLSKRGLIGVRPCICTRV
jgi:hypothetical protein